MKTYSKFLKKSGKFLNTSSKFDKIFGTFFENDLKIFFKNSLETFRKRTQNFKRKSLETLIMTSKGPYSPFIESSLVRSQFIYHWKFFGKVPNSPFIEMSLVRSLFTIHWKRPQNLKKYLETFWKRLQFFKKKAWNFLKAYSKDPYSPFIDFFLVRSLFTFHWKFFSKVLIHVSLKVLWYAPY